MKNLKMMQSEISIFNAFMINPDSTEYNLPHIITLDKTVDIEKLKAAVKKCIGYSESFNARFDVDENGNPYKYIVTEEARVEVVKTENFKFEDYTRPFDLRNEGPYRAIIFDLPEKTVLFYDFHHIIYDGTSNGIFAELLSRAYNGVDIGTEEHSAAYFAEKEENLRNSDAWNEAYDYFKKSLEAADGDGLPLKDEYDKEVIPKQFRKSCKASKFSNIRKFAKDNGLKVSSAFYTAFSYVLSKACGTDTAFFRTVFTGRDEESAKTMGMFVKTYHMLHTFAGEDILENIKSIDLQNNENRKHSIFSDNDVVNKLGIGAGVTFSYQGGSIEGHKINIGGQDAICDNKFPGDVKNPLSILAFTKGDEIIFSAEYDGGKFSEKFVEGMMDMMDSVLSEITFKKNFSEITLLSEENTALLEAFHGEDADYDTSKTFLDLFREQVKKNPDNIAVICNDEKITYKELDTITDKIAIYLANKGIGKEAVVSVLVGRNTNMPVCAIGVLKSGAGYQPLDYTYPSERLNFMMQDASVKFLIADEELLHLVEGTEAEILLTKDIPTLENNGQLPDAPKPENLFVMLYTSGSTGMPKGCMVEHKNIVAYINWCLKAYKFDENSVASCYASFGFDACLFDIYPALSCGAAIAIVPEDIRLDFPKLEEYFRKNNVTHAEFTTQVGRQVAEYFSYEGLKYISVGGEKLGELKKNGNFEFYNLYGPSECTICVTGICVDRKFEDIPIGKPHENVKAYIIDKHGRRLPVGFPGELCIAGPRVTRGYLNRPEKTAEVYVKNNFDQSPKYSRLYRTGDVVRWLSDGNLSFVGRADSQVKVRGFRIELSEVENVIREFAKIKDVTVVAYDNPSGGKYLCAYYVSETEIDEGELKQFILDRKPPYMVPGVLMRIEKIPYNQNMKVNKKILPKPERKNDNLVKPQNDTQQKIFDCVAEATGTSDFGIDTDYYSAGLTSISSIKLTILLSKAFGRNISIADIKENNTVLKTEGFFANRAEEKSYEIQTDYPLSKTQQGIFTECIADEKSTAYNIPYCVKFNGEIDIERLKNAISKVFSAHPYLITELFYDEEGEIRARRKDNDAPKITVFNAQKLPNSSALVVPFNLTGEKLYRIEIFDTGEGVYLFMDFHHIIFDGESLMIFVQELSKVYEGADLEKEGFTAFEFALEEEENLKGDKFLKAKEYYEGLLAGCETDCMPERSPEAGESVKGTAGRILAIKKSEIENVCENGKFTINAFMNGAFGYVLARLIGAKESVYTTIYNGRSDARLANDISMFVKTLPVVFRFDDKDAVSGTMKNFGKQLSDSMANDIYSFAEISRDFGVSADILFVYEGDIGSVESLCGTKVENISMDSDQPKAPISIIVSLNGENIIVSCEYGKNTYNKQAADNLLEVYDKVISEMCQKDKIFSDISMLSENQKAILDKFNETDYPYDDSVTVVDMIRKNAKLYPNKLAVVYEDKKYTYKQLDEITDNMAKFLASKGIGREDVVSVLVERNEFMPICALGVAKSGAGYQPLDPTYPAERLKFMMEDASAKYLIAEEKLLPLVDGGKIKGVEVPVLKTSELESLPSDGELPEGPKTDSLLVMLYTSGSTGTPKGCMIEHRNLVAYVNWCKRYFEVDETSTVGSFASFGFDACMMELFMAMTMGATLVVAPTEIRLQFDKLQEYYKKNKVSHCVFTTQVGRQMAEYFDYEELKYISVGGEKLADLKIPEKFTFVNQYGPSECTVGATAIKVKKEYLNIPIGKPNDNVKAYVVDGNGKRLPVGIPGELWLAGPQVSRGYLNRPEKNAQVFISNPFSDTKKYARIYRTGDVVRMLSDGNIEFVGRADSQVKIRGFRIELTEVESVIRDFEGIKDVAVVAFDSASGGKFLAAYYVADNDINIHDLEEFIKSKKPPYMVPSAISRIEKIPYTNNMKVNKKALPKPSFEKTETAKIEKLMPSNELETDICKIFEEVLGIENIGITDNFFEFGGSSISASKVAMKAMLKNLPIAYADIFKNPTPLKLEIHVLRRKAEEGAKILGEGVDEKHGEIQQREALEPVLRHNIIPNLKNLTSGSIGNVMLTGATGFLGMHLLHNLIENYDCKIYCLVRKSHFKNSDDRLKALLGYYFSNSYEELFNTRIFTINGDITDKTVVESLANVDFDTMINSAASVKHFASDDSLYNINFHGVENLIELCTKCNKRLIHISTASVAGENVGGKLSRSRKIFESELSIGQELANQYTHSKFLAEQAILDAVMNKGLDAKIMRMGNIMSRQSDGEFQINFRTNGFIRTLRAYAVMGQIPYSILDTANEFSPVDSCAEAILLLSGTPKEFTVFHTRNSHTAQLGDIIQAFNDSGITITPVSDEEFAETLNKTMKDPEKAPLVAGIISYLNSDKNTKRTFIDSDNTFSTKALYKLGFRWPLTDLSYIQSAVKALATLGFYDGTLHD